MVAVTARSWRPFAAPAAFLLAVTLALVGARALWPHAKAPHPTHRSQAHVHKQAGPSAYVVKPGDTLASVAAKTGVPVARMLGLNPKLVPTALFIGQRIRLR